MTENLRDGPDYIGVGAEKSGTTWWHTLISKHPEVCSRLGGEIWQEAGSRKELKYFVRPSQAEISEESIILYRSQFRRGMNQIAGEWTPRYMYDFWTPRLLHVHAPDAKLIAMLRDPLDRMISGYAHSYRRRLANDTWMLVDAFQRSDYWPQLQNIFHYYSRDQVLVLQFEACVNNPLPYLRHTYKFIGCRVVDYVPDGYEKAVNRAPAPKPPIPSHIMAEARRKLADGARIIVAEFPGFQADLWPTLH